MAMTVREAFEKGTETFNAHDIDGFTGVLADDGYLRRARRDQRPGQGGLRPVFAGWFGAFPDAHVQVHALHIADDVAVEEGTFTGTHNGILHTPAGDILPTGRPVAADYIQVLRFREGRHVSFSLMYDRLLLLEQLGLIPAPAATD
jgi:ketosteroid isomerase-like protein